MLLLLDCQGIIGPHEAALASVVGTKPWLWYTVSMETDEQEPRVDRSALSVVDLHDVSDDVYWRSRSLAERLEAIEINRQVIYGYGQTPPRLQRILEVARR